MEAFIELLKHVPTDSGMAFVLIQHLDPKHESYLAEAVAHATTLSVEEIKDGVLAAPNHVYVIPSNSDVTILNGAFGLLPRPEGRKPHMAIDFFFSALAAEQGSAAIGVLLSGTGSDGTIGLREIKAAGGITLAQEPSQARFSGMPESAIKAGVVDFVLAASGLAEELERLARRPYTHPLDDEAPPAGDVAELKHVFALVRNEVGADFSEYKLSSIRRRVARRMAVRHVATLPEYVQSIRQDHTEAKALFDDILIQVTSFFRDPAVFEQLKTLVFPEILKKKRDGGAIRIWSSGCSSGEEAYSLIIGLQEFLAKENATDVPVQMFGTDISESAIEKARAGFYRESALGEVSPERLARYFTAEEGGFRINKLVRERCAFVKHDLARDPPFSKMDLVACRNVLIYFGVELQKRVLATFHFALNDPGFLLLGSAENIASDGQLFSVVDNESKIFARTATKSVLRLAPARDVYPAVATRHPARPSAPTDVIGRAEAILLEQFTPPGVIVNERMEILHFRGRTGSFLEPAPGAPQYDVLKMAKKGLMAELRIAITQAKKDGATVRRDGVRFDDDGASRVCNIIVVPVPARADNSEGTYAVLFDEARAQTVRPGEGPVVGAPGEDRIGKLEAELKATKDYLGSTIEEHQRTNEELMSANEELMSSNEELQSLNEEMETAKEEMQSTNEELNTLNEELQTRNGELNEVNSDLVNILGSVEVPIVIVDGARHIRRYTPKARTMLNLLPSDVGRPIDDIKPSLDIADLDRKIADVIETVTIHEEQARGKDGRWYRLQIRPYTTIEKKIDGAVLSIVDIDALKRALGAAEWARDFASALVDASPTPEIVLTEELKIISINELFKETYGMPPESVGCVLFEVLDGAFDFPELRVALEGTRARGGRFKRLEAEREIPGLGVRWLSISGRGVAVPGTDRIVLVAVEDVTDRVRLLEAATLSRASAEQANRAKDAFLATVTHELRTPLSSLIMDAALLRKGGLDDARMRKAFERIELASKAQAQLIDDLLNVSQIATGKLKMEMHAVDLATVVASAVEMVRSAAEKKHISIAVEAAPPGTARVAGDEGRLGQVLWNLLINAVKFTAVRGHVTLTLDVADGRGRIRVSDDGIGIAPDFLPYIFDRFSQEDRALSRSHGGLGLGLSIVRYIAEAHGGSVTAESAGAGRGATFTVTIPLLHAMEAVPVRAAPLGSIKGMRVLVVEDDAGTRDALEEMLKVRGAEVRTAPSVATALTLLAAEKPDVVVSDIAMPEEDGYSLIRRIRALSPEAGADVPALALTALAGVEDRRRALGAGFGGLLEKPVDADRLVAALAALMATRSSASPPS